jgi:hypothetical protein
MKKHLKTQFLFIKVFLVRKLSQPFIQTIKKIEKSRNTEWKK